MNAGKRIRQAEGMVLNGIRPYLYYNEGGDLCIMLNEPNRKDPKQIGAVIHHGLVLSEHKPENIKELRSIVRGWVMGAAATLPGEDE